MNVHKLAGIRSAARRLGISTGEYATKRANGFLWCGFGRHWSDAKTFNKNIAAGSGKSDSCKACSNTRDKERRDKKKCRK